MPEVLIMDYPHIFIILELSVEQFHPRVMEPAPIPLVEYKMEPE